MLYSNTAIQVLCCSHDNTIGMSLPQAEQHVNFRWHRRQWCDTQIRSPLMKGCLLQLEDFSFEEIAQVLWVAARVSQEDKVHPVTYAALRVWPNKLLEAAQSREKLQRPTPKNLAQLAFAYGSPQSVFTRSNVRALCHCVHH
jgi:hypothetical protein